MSFEPQFLTTNCHLRCKGPLPRPPPGQIFDMLKVFWGVFSAKIDLQGTGASGEGPGQCGEEVEEVEVATERVVQPRS